MGRVPRLPGRFAGRTLHRRLGHGGDRLRVVRRWTQGSPGARAALQDDPQSGDRLRNSGGLRRRARAEEGRDPQVPAAVPHRRVRRSFTRRAEPQRWSLRSDRERALRAGNAATWVSGSTSTRTAITSSTPPPSTPTWKTNSCSSSRTATCRTSTTARSSRCRTPAAKSAATSSTVPQRSVPGSRAPCARAQTMRRAAARSGTRVSSRASRSSANAIWWCSS